MKKFIKIVGYIIVLFISLGLIYSGIGKAASKIYLEPKTEKIAFQLKESIQETRKPPSKEDLSNFEDQLKSTGMVDNVGKLYIDFVQFSDTSTFTVEVSYYETKYGFFLSSHSKTHGTGLSAPQQLISVNNREDTSDVKQISRNTTISTVNKTSDGLLLINAVKILNDERISELLGKGVSPDSTDENGKTGLMHDALNPNSAGVGIMVLLMNHANPNIQDNQGKTALMYNILRDNTSPTGTELLLKYGADPNIQDSHGMTALMYAVQKSDIDAVRQLLGKGANLSLKNNEGKEAIQIAEDLNNTEIVEILAEW